VQFGGQRKLNQALPRHCARRIQQWPTLALIAAPIEAANLRRREHDNILPITLLARRL
jgi:hypothetical protein